MHSYDLSDNDFLRREVARLPRQAEALFPIEVPFLKRHGVADSCRLWDIGCGDGSWLHLFHSAFPNSVITGLDHSPEILSHAKQQNPGVPFLLVDEKNISEILVRGEFDIAILRFSLQHMSPDTRTRILSALHSRRAPTRIIAIDGDDRSFVFRPKSDAIQTLIEEKGRKQAAVGGDRHIGSKLSQLFTDLGFGLIKQDSMPISSKTIGWDTLWSAVGPIVLSGAKSPQDGLVDQATTWFKQNRNNQDAIMATHLFMVSGSNTAVL